MLFETQSASMGRLNALRNLFESLRQFNPTSFLLSAIHQRAIMIDPMDKMPPESDLPRL